MINQVNIDDMCWWCGDKADSAEHIYKKTDLHREFGWKTKFIENKPVVVREQDEIIPVETSKSKIVKFHKSLCEKCNTSRSQPFDNAYDILADFVKRNEDSIYQKQEINFEEIYGRNWSENFKTLKRYYVKNFCCQLNSKGVEILPSLLDFLNGADEHFNLAINMYLRSDIYMFLKLPTNDTGFLNRSGITGQKSISQNSFYFLESSISYRSFTVGYYYSNEGNFFFPEPDPIYHLQIWNNPNFNLRT